MAKQVPGKEEFFEMLRYLQRRVETTGVLLHLNQRVAAADLHGFDEIVVATGVIPRDPKIPGQDHPKVLSYIEVLREHKPVGERVAVIGAGGIGFDVAEFLVHSGVSTTLDLPAWQAEWGVTDPEQAPGGLSTEAPAVSPPARHVTLLQRKAGKLGAGLGKTTGWIHRTALKHKQVQMVGGVNYEQIGEQGLLVSYGKERQDPTWIACDNVVLCAGQVPLRELADELQAQGQAAHLIGGALQAGELDAKRAIDQAARLAARL
jgi:2,4-dienoyl-CoA reductase (NADPH2)